MVVGDDHAHASQSGRGMRRHPPLARGIAVPPTGHRVGPRVGEGSAALGRGGEQRNLSHAPPASALRCRAGTAAKVRMTAVTRNEGTRAAARCVSGAASRWWSLALAAALRGRRGRGDSEGAVEIDVVGSGTLAWEQVVVRTRPTPESPRVAVLRQFRADFRPQYVLALDERLDAEGRAELVPRERPRPAQRAEGLGARRRARPPARPEAAHRLPRRAAVRVLGRRQARAGREGRGGQARRGDAARPLLRHLEVQPRRSTPSGRSSARTPSRRARTRSSRTGPAEESSASTARPGPSFSARPSRTAACACRTRTSGFLRPRIPLGTPVKIVR